LNSIHKFTVASIEGREINFADFKGKKIMVVNVASECGFTSQYQQLQELSEKFPEQLVIVGFPANNFGAQEPGSNQEIHAFCTSRFGVTFPLTAKVSVKGTDQTPVYEWLTQKSANGVLDSEVKWNFQKYLLDEQGQLVATYPSNVSPTDEVIMNWIVNK